MRSIAALLFSALAARAGTPPAPPQDAPAGELKTYSGGKRLKLPSAANAADAEGIRLLAAGDAEGAVAAFDRSLKVARNNPRARANRGVAYDKLGRLDDALHDFATALAFAPDAAPALRSWIVDARVRRGRGRLEGGRVRDALDDFYAAIRSDRKDGRGYAAVAETARKTGQNATCVSYASRAIDLGAAAIEVLAGRAACLAALGKKTDAVKDLDRALLTDSARADLFASRSELERALGRVSAAHRDAKRAVELDPSLAPRLAPALR